MHERMYICREPSLRVSNHTLIYLSPTYFIGFNISEVTNCADAVSNMNQTGQYFTETAPLHSLD